MLKWLRRLLILAAGLVLLTVVVAWWLLNDEAWLEDQVEQAVTDATGRRLDIVQLQVDWSLDPVIRAGRVALANPDWADKPELVAITGLHASLDLRSLWRPPFRVHYVRAEGVDVWLESNARNEHSWDLPGADAEPASPDDDTTPEVRLGALDLARVTLGFQAPGRAAPLSVDLDWLRLEAMDGGAALLDIAGSVEQRPTRIDGRIAPFRALVDGGPSEHELNLRLGETTLNSRGRLANSHALVGAELDFQLSGPDIGFYLEALSLPPIAQGPFDVSLDVETQDQQSTLQLAGNVGDIQASFEARTPSLDSLDNVQVQGQLSGPDWPVIARALGLPGTAEGSFTLAFAGGRQAGQQQIDLLAFKVGDVSLEARGVLGDAPDWQDSRIALVFEGPSLGAWVHEGSNLDTAPIAFRLDAEFTRTGMEPAEVAAQLALSDSLLILDGSLGRLPGLDGADLRLTGQGPADGELMRLLKIDGLPNDDIELDIRLRREGVMTFFDPARIDLAGHRLDVRGQVGEWPALDDTQLTLDLQGPDLAAWGPITRVEGLPAEPYRVSGQLVPAGDLLRVEDAQIEVGPNRVTLSGDIGNPPEFAGTRFTFDVQGEDLSDLRALPGLEAAPPMAFGADGRIAARTGGLELNDIQLRLGTSRTQLDGTLLTADQLLGSQLRFQFRAEDLAELGHVIGRSDFPTAALSMLGVLDHRPDGWHFDLQDGRLADTDFHSQGVFHVQGGEFDVTAASHIEGPSLAGLGAALGVELPDQPFSIDGTMHYEASRLVARSLTGAVGRTRFDGQLDLGPAPDHNGSSLVIDVEGPDLAEWLPSPEPGEPLPFALKGHLAREHNDLVIHEFDATLGPMEASMAGTIGDPGRLGRTAVSVNVQAASLAPVGDRLGFDLPDQALSFQAQLQGDPDRFQADTLALTLGESRVTGELAVDLTDRPTIMGRLDSPLLDLSWLSREEAPDDPQPAPGDGRLIPDTPMPILRFEAMDLDLEARVTRLELSTQTFHDIEARLRTEQDRLTLDPFHFRANHGGVLDGRLTVRHDTPAPRFELSLRGDDVQLGLATVEGQDTTQLQRGLVEADLTGEGATWRAFAGSLDGHLLVSLGEGLTANQGMSLFFGDFIGELFTLLNPFAEKEAFTNNTCDVYAARIRSGQVTLGPVVSVTDKIMVVADGTIDLNTEKLNVTFNSTPRKGIGISAGMVLNPFLKLYGTLNSPLIGLDPAGVAVQGSVAVATAGLSLLAKGLSDRFLSSKDPCGDALAKAREQQAEE